MQGVLLRKGVAPSNAAICYELYPGSVLRSMGLLAGCVLAALFLSSASGGTATASAPTARVGVNYFDGWSGPLSGFHFDGLAHAGVNGQFPGRRPLSGWRDYTTAAMGAQLEWAYEDGVDFFNFDWYYGGERSSDPFLNNALGGYRKLADHRGVGFALNYINVEPFAVPGSEWSKTAEQWVTEDFLNPDYARIDGKPILLVWDSIRFHDQRGGTAGVNAALGEIRRRAMAHGLPGVFVIGSVFIGTNVDRVGWDYFSTLIAGETYDALTANAYPAAAGERDGQQPFADLIAAGQAGWDGYLRLGFRTIPTVMDGWDPRPWNETAGTRLWWFSRSPAEVGAFVRNAIGWVTAHPTQQVDTRPLILMMSWNEPGEGEYIVPTEADHYAYGQALAQAIGITWTPPPKLRLAVSVTPRGGEVRSNPATIRCHRSCKVRVDFGQQITLTALPRPGYKFRHWSGDCRGRAPTCTILVERANSVKATFARG